MTTQKKKISIRIKQKNNIISLRNINKSSNNLYKYSRTDKAYIKKSKIEISKIRFIESSKRKEKIITRKVIKQVGKRKEKLIQKKIKEVPKKEIPKKEKLIQKKIKEVPKKEIPKKEKKIIPEEEIIIPERGYNINTYSFTCKVSDRKIEHDFSIRDEIDDKILEMHENKYPDHEVITYEELGSRFIAYGKGGAFNGDIKTEKQKEFLKMLGVPEEIIGTIKSKSDASKWINRYNKKI